MRKFKGYQNLFLLSFFIVITPFNKIFSQIPDTSPKNGGYWVGYMGDNKINKRIGIHSEIQMRNFFLNDYQSTLIIRTGLHVYLKPYSMATLGYAFIYGAPNGSHLESSITSENRIWQQIILRQKNKGLFMEHRYRLEQRFIENLTLNTSRTDHRLRYRFQMLVPLYSVSPHLRHFFVATNNEIMVNFNSNPSQVFDRNRFFTGLGFQVSPKLNFQIGYLNQWAAVPNNNKASIDHLLSLGVSYNMDDLMQTFFKKAE